MKKRLRFPFLFTGWDGVMAIRAWCWGEESVLNLPLSITYCGPKLEVFIFQRREDLVSEVYDVLLLEGIFL